MRHIKKKTQKLDVSLAVDQTHDPPTYSNCEDLDRIYGSYRKREKNLAFLNDNNFSLAVDQMSNLCISPRIL